MHYAMSMGAKDFAIPAGALLNAEVNDDVEVCWYQ